MALLSGSPAIGQGDPSRCGTTDQRGFVIAHDGDHVACDIGAYEVFLPPRLKSAPKISGKHRVGKTLKCGTGRWAGATPLHFSYRWRRDGKAIKGATHARYSVKRRDLHHHLSCLVTASNVAGKASAHSAGVKIVSSRK